ncbi:glycosyltransferase family 4 protein [Pontibacter sp. 13R65]|uniref:glycosyltransferase family 4 protein n=1 Tax=Pontibacter sp. 13R65 TaxID=3127458 RepID=UPI00301CB690
MYDNKDLQEQYELTVICPQLQTAPPLYTSLILRQSGKLEGHLWEQLELPFLSGDGYLLNLCNVAPLLKRDQAVMIHDTAVYAWPKAYSFIFRIWYKMNYMFTSCLADMLLTVSEFSKSELIKYVNTIPSKVHVTYPASVFKIDPTSKRNREGVGIGGAPYVLAVSSLSPHKNLKAVIKALHLLPFPDIRLFVVGGKFSQVFNNPDLESEDQQHVNFLGYVTDEQLAELYQKALCFVYPSYYEGFGLPPLEAMACGCPVVVSDRASLPEVCGEAALYCDPDKPESISSAIQKLYLNPDLVHTLVNRGYEQVCKFSFDSTASRILQLVLKNVNC